MKKLIMASLLVFLLIGCSSGGGDTFIQEAPLPEAVPTNGTNIIVTAEGESNVGLSYTNVGEGAILIECGDDCDLTVNEASPTTDNSVVNEDSNGTEDGN